MTPIRVSTRLEQLQSLERRERLQGEIVAEGGQPAHPARPLRGVPKTRRKKAEDKVQHRLELLGATAHEVKVWAVSVGLVDQGAPRPDPGRARRGVRRP